MDREAWRAVVHGVTKSQTWLSDWAELNNHIILGAPTATLYLPCTPKVYSPPSYTMYLFFLPRMSHPVLYLWKSNTLGFFLNTQDFYWGKYSSYAWNNFFFPFLLLFLVNFHICIRPQIRCCFFGESIITRITMIRSSAQVLLLSYTMSYIPTKLISFPYKIVSFLKA